jgi:hypothetical protein
MLETRKSAGPGTGPISSLGVQGVYEVMIDSQQALKRPQGSAAAAQAAAEQVVEELGLVLGKLLALAPSATRLQAHSKWQASPQGRELLAAASAAPSQVAQPPAARPRPSLADTAVQTDDDSSDSASALGRQAAGLDSSSDVDMCTLPMPPAAAPLPPPPHPHQPGQPQQQQGQQQPQQSAGGKGARRRGRRAGKQVKARMARAAACGSGEQQQRQQQQRSSQRLPSALLNPSAICAVQRIAQDAIQAVVALAQLAPARPSPWRRRRTRRPRQPAQQQPLSTAGSSVGSASTTVNVTSPPPVVGVAAALHGITKRPRPSSLQHSTAALSHDSGPPPRVGPPE